MEYGRNKMNEIYKTPDLEDHLDNDYTNLYQVVCLTQDFTNWEDAPFYKSEELALEVV